MHRGLGRLAFLLAGAACMAVLAGVAFAATGSGHGPATHVSAKKQYVIGLVVDDLANEFHTRVADAAKLAAKQNNVTLKVLDDHRDTAQEATAIDQLVAEKVDMILVLCTSATGTPAALDRAMKAGVKVMTVVDSCNGSGSKYRYVGNDLTGGAGAIPQAQELVKMLHGKGNVVYIKGDPGSAVTHHREAGFMSVIKKYPGIKVIYNQNGDWLEPSGQTKMEDALTRFPANGSTKIDAVATHDDLMALGAIQALKSANRLKGTVVAGSDGTIEGLTSVAKGEMTFTVFNDA